MMTVTALFSTSGATNAGLYPAPGLCEQMTAQGQFPPILGRRFGGRAAAGLLLTAAVSMILAAGYDLSSIASIGSAIALVVFGLVTVAHFRVYRETGANRLILGVALASIVIVLTTFVFTTLVNEPGTIVALVVIVALSVALDLIWKRMRAARDGDRAIDLTRPEPDLSPAPHTT
jgi:amino acid transporter